MVMRMDKAKLHRFYCSKAWTDLAHMLKVQRGGRCERTGEIYEDMSQLIAHHRVELNDINVDDPQVSLNPDNIEIISFLEHNREHRRFGNSKNVYIVWGPPLSGKSTLVKQSMQYGDIVMDIDALWQAITLQPMYIKPNNVRFNVFRLRDNMYDQIRTRYGQFYDAYVVASLPDKYDREKLSERLGAELIQCVCEKEECYERFARSGKPIEWKTYIDEWFERFNGV